MFWDTDHMEGDHYPVSGVFAPAEGDIPAPLSEAIEQARRQGVEWIVQVYPRGVYELGSVWNTNQLDVFGWIVSWPIHWIRYRGQYVVAIREKPPCGRKGRVLRAVYVKSHRLATLLRTSLVG
jgi:hypothetical protein